VDGEKKGGKKDKGKKDKGKKGGSEGKVDLDFFPSHSFLCKTEVYETKKSREEKENHNHTSTHAHALNCEMEIPV
jgi:hypothetical protein